MKINKILAAGVAATLAVTSVGAVVASAETKTFDMAKTLGNFTVNYGYKSYFGRQVENSAVQADKQQIDFYIHTLVSVFEDNDGTTLIHTYPYGTAGTELKKADSAVGDYDANECKEENGKFHLSNYKYLGTYDLADGWAGDCKVTVNGFKKGNDDKMNSVSQTVTVKRDGWVADGVWSAEDFVAGLCDAEEVGLTISPMKGHTYRLTVLPDTELSYKDDAIAPSYFDTIDNIEVTAAGKILAANDGDIINGDITNETEWNIINSKLSGRKIFVSNATILGTEGKQGTGDIYTNSKAHNEPQVRAQLNLAATEAAAAGAETEIAVVGLLEGDVAETANIEGKTVYERDEANDAIKATAGAAAITLDAGATFDAEVKLIVGDDVFSAKKVTADPATAANVGKYVAADVAAGDADVDAFTVADVDDKVLAYKAKAAATTAIADADNAYEKITPTVDGAGAVAEAKSIVAGTVKTTAFTAITAATGVAPAEVAGTANVAAAVLAYCIAHGGYSPTDDAYTETKPSSVGGYTSEKFSLLERTTTDGTIKRFAVNVLSIADAYTAANGGHLGSYDTNQSYYDESKLGDNPFQFAGLASQVADFFNKKTNGKIIFHFTTPAKGSNSWKNGGVPSTEVGLKSSLAGSNFGLFVNYRQSTGSLQTAGIVDSDAATVTFDITDILDKMGGLTMGNVSDLYYGLNTGLKYSDYDNKVGYLVDTVTLSYDENAAATDGDKATQNDDDDDDDDDDDTDVTDDDDDDDDDADDADDDDDDDDDDASLDDDDDDDDDVANAEDINTPADDDANPGTGVALAVIPAIVAAAAAVVSKKRK